MSKLGQKRKSWNYETNVPRCETCVNVLRPQVYLTRDSIPVRSHWRCKAGEFTIQPNACCDRWKSKTGEVVK